MFEEGKVERFEYVPSISATTAVIGPVILDVEGDHEKTFIVKTDEGGTSSASVLLLDETGAAPSSVADLQSRGIPIGKGSGLKWTAGGDGNKKRFRVFATQSPTATGNVEVSFMVGVLEKS